MKAPWLSISLSIGGAIACSILLLGCKQGASEAAGIPPQKMADALHAVVEADRIVYTRKVVNRLTIDEKVIKASEHWQDDQALPLPAQMFRMGAEMVTEKNVGFTYSLLSLWPVNKQNKAKTKLEQEGLKFVADHPEKNFYGEEKLGNTMYYTAVYPDKAVAPACIECHNNHKDTPRQDFNLGDVMGGVVIRIPVR